MGQLVLALLLVSTTAAALPKPLRCLRALLLPRAFFPRVSAPMTVPQVRRAFVLTHQIDRLMAATETRVTAETWRGLPVVLLPAPSGTLTAGLLTRADAVHDDTPYAFPFDTDEVHVAGGNADLCLASTVHALIEAFLKEPRRRLKIVVHADLTYLRHKQTFWEHFDQGSRPERLGYIATSAARQFFPPSDPRWRPVSYHPEDHRYTDGKFVVEIRAVAE